MRIAFCLTTYELFDSRCAPLARMLKDKGHEILVMTFLEGAGMRSTGEFNSVFCNWPLFEISALEDFIPDLIIVWNGRFPGMHGAVAWMRSRYRVVTMEMGWYTQKDNSYLADDLAQISRISRVAYEPNVASLTHHIKALENARRQYRPKLPEGVEVPEKFIFIPMQLEQDTQILSTSSSFKTMASVIGYVRFKYPGIPIIVRNHPCDMYKERPDYVLNYSNICPSLPLALRSIFVVGINSTVLAESMLFNKKTIALGSHVAAPVIKERDNEALYNEDHYNYRSLVLIYNQWDYKNPPGWVIDKIIDTDFSPRVVSQIKG